MATKACVNRLQKEYKAILREPVPSITAHPAPNNLLDWHYVLEGPQGSDFEGGCYHGKVTFPPEYPFKPPSIVMLTPNGRFAVNTKLCLSYTNFHPESWNPLWSVSTILTGLLSFLLESQHTTGAISTSSAEKRRLARESLAYNVRNPTFRKLFPEWVQKFEQQQASAAAAAAEAKQQGAQAVAPAGQGAQGNSDGVAAPVPAQQGLGTGGVAAAPGAAHQQGQAQWSGYLVGAAAVATAGVAAMLMLRSQDGGQ